MNDEVELKLNINRKDAPRLRKHPAIAVAGIGKPTTHKLLSIYYDTPDLTLLDAEISLRVRHISGRWIQTIKATGSSTVGLHQRREWEDVIASEHLDFTKIHDPKLIKLFDDKKLRDMLIPIFQTEVQRSEWQLAFDNGDRVELALDLGQLIVDKKSEAICEIELELKAGNVGRLFDLALEFLKDIPLTIENTSKAQRGYAYYRTKPPGVLNARPPKLKKDTNVHNAFKQIAWECIHQLQGNQDMVLHGTDVEGVHQMRVALRRLRSAFTVFANILGREHSAALLAELSWLADVLGKTRDLDVFVTQTLPIVMARFKEDQGLLKLHDKALVAQSEAYKEVRALLFSHRYQCLLLTLATWLENESWREKRHKHKFVKALSLANVVLEKCHKQLRTRGIDLVNMSPEFRHETRIAAKKLRYAAEFFASLYTSKKSSQFILSLSQLQDCLGVLNDIYTTDRLLHQLINPSSDISLNEALRIFANWNASNAIYFDANLNDTWQAFISKKPFWN
jgi:inorganic triphosphatase YgiF